MKITIDTSQDSHSEIKKAIRMLQSIVGYSDEAYTNSPSRNIFDDPSPSVGSNEPVAEQNTGNAFASIFDDPVPGSAAEEAKEEEEDAVPQIEFF